MENTTQGPKSNGWKVLGIISVVLAGLSILFSFIPCLGQYAMYSGGLAVLLSGGAFMMANNAGASKTLAIIGLVISIASIGIGYWQHTLAVKAEEGFKNMDKGFQHRADSAFKAMDDSMKKHN